MSRFRELAPVILMGVMGNSVIYLIPLLVGGMVTDRGFSEQQAGWLASLDLGGYALAAALTAFHVDRFDWRHLARIGLGIMVVANVATSSLQVFDAFAAARVASGFGCGLLAGLASVALSRMDNPERNFGVLLGASLLFGTAGLWGLPALLDAFGLAAAYWLLAGLAVVATILAVPGLPAHSESAADEEVGVGEMSWVAAVLVLASITCFWAEQNALYAYVERIAHASGLEAGYIGFVLGMANLTGFGGAALVAWMGARAGRLLPLAMATVVQLACFWVLAGTLTPMTFLLALTLTATAWNVVNPFQLGILAAVDPSGRTLALAATFSGVGLAIGPAAGAQAISGSHYSGVLALSTILAVASLVLLLPPLQRIAATAARKAAP